MSLLVTALTRQHDRTDFDCGEPELNGFLQRMARQQADRDFNRTYVAVLEGSARIHGFYSVSSASIDFQNWPEHLRLPRYPVPAMRIGRLAVNRTEQGNGVGLMLLQHAMQLATTTAQQIGLYAVVVDAKHEKAAAFYERYGFTRFPFEPLALFITTDMIRRAFKAANA